MSTTIVRATLCDVRANPHTDPGALRLERDAALWIDAAGTIVRRGPATEIPPGAEVIDLADCLLLPGAVDAHVHYPQVFMQAAHGEKLLEWLERYTFPSELRYADAAFARRAAAAFCGQLVGAGTTTACIYGSVFEPANRACFEAAQRCGLRAILGPTAMDRAVPEGLRTPADRTHALYETLIERYHRPPTSGVALTPRFALSCSRAQLDVFGALLREFPSCPLQTHINENRAEIEAVHAAFEDAPDYLAVYEAHGLLGPHTLLGHSVYTTDAELARMKATHTRVVHCPTSNLFLGSGVFSLRRHRRAGVHVCLGTDIGAGMDFSVFASLPSAYGMAQLDGCAPRAGELLYLATLAGAEALGWQAHIGNLEPGKRADFVCVDPALDPFLRERLRQCESDHDFLFALLINLRTRHIRDVYIDGLPRARQVEELAAGL